jgi:hypothetical protein
LIQYFADDTISVLKAWLSDRSMALRGCSGVRICQNSRLLLQHNTTICRHKYTAPTLQEVVNKKRTKFSAHQHHKPSHVATVLPAILFALPQYLKKSSYSSQSLPNTGT